MREAKRLGQKMTMLYVSTLDEADAAAQAGIDILSIESKFMSRAMREAAGDCFVQVGLIYGDLVTAEDYLREAFLNTKLGGDCFYCSASLDIQKTLSDNSIPIVGHVGLVPSQCTWTGGFKAAGKTRSDEHTSELQSCESISYAVFCLQKKTQKDKIERKVKREKRPCALEK